MPQIRMESGAGGREWPPLEASHPKLDVVEKTALSGAGAWDLAESV